MGLFEQLPYTNFHNLNLTELIKFVNETIKHIHEMDLTIEEQNQTITDFKNYVMDYLNNLDVEQDVKDYIDELISNGTMATLVNKSIFSGKNIVWYGDSWGTTADNPVQKFIDEYTDTTVTNRCIGGTTLSRITISPHEYDSGYQRIMSANDLSSFDYIFIMYSINDWQVSVPLKTTSPDEYEYIYCVENIIDYLQTTYPMCIPVFIFPTYCYKHFASSDINGINYAGVNLPGYINNAISICERKNVKYINLFELSGITRKNYASHLKNDGGIYVHLKPDMSEQVAKLIYWGKFNTGKCYGDNWSNNLITSSIDTSVVATRTEATTLVSGVVSTPVKKITTSDYHNLLNNPCNEPITVGHLTFYKNDSVVYGIYVQRQNSGDPVDVTGITNISSIGLVDCYFEVDTTDLINIMLITTSGTALLNGVSAEIKTTNKDIISDYNLPNAHSDVTVILSHKPYIKNGVVTVPTIQFNADANINAFDAVFSNLPLSYSGEAIYIVAIDVTANDIIPAYLVNDTIRFTRSLTSGKTYIVPEFTYNSAH